MVKVAAAIIIRHGQILLAQRPVDKHQGGLWEFPGGKIETGETAQAALARELLEEINIRASEMAHFQSVEFTYPDKRVQLAFYKVEKFEGEPKGLEGQPVEWFPLAAITQLEFPAANQPIVEALLAEH